MTPHAHILVLAIFCLEIGAVLELALDAKLALSSQVSAAFAFQVLGLKSHVTMLNLTFFLVYFYLVYTGGCLHVWLCERV